MFVPDITLSIQNPKANEKIEQTSFTVTGFARGFDPTPDPGPSPVPGDPQPFSTRSTEDFPVNLTISVTGAGSVTRSDVFGNWEPATFNVTTPGTKTITVDAEGFDRSNNRVTNRVTRTINVVLDKTPPSVKINQPNSGQIIGGVGPKYSLNISGNAKDSESNIKTVQYRVDGGTFKSLTNIGNSKQYDWSARLTNLSVGSHKLEVRARDKHNNTSSLVSHNFTLVDTGKPNVEITNPEFSPHRVTLKDDKVLVDVTGTASDITTQIKFVKWRLDDGQLNDAINSSGNWSSWRFTAEISTPGVHNIEVIATDNANNSESDSIQIDVAVPFELEEVDFAAYLKDLTIFTERRIRQSDGIAINPTLLTANFYQPFKGLFNSNLKSITTKPVAQVRIAIEVLRSFIDNYEQFSEYCETAYGVLLTNLGTSYSELRLARGADAQTRQSLANRLGIEETDLNMLFVSPEQMTEEKLELMFGLVDTTKEALRVVDPAKMLTLRLDKLQTSWREQDELALNKARDKQELPTPTIDPDLIEDADLKNLKPTNTAFNLLEQRRQFVAQLRESIQNTAEAIAEPLERFDSIVDSVLGTIDLSDLGEPYTEIQSVVVALEQAYQDGLDIEPYLNDIPLDLTAFLVLFGMRKLAETGIILDSEWTEVYNILVQIQKQREFVTWTEEEINANLTLEPGFFITRSTRPELIMWRSSYSARRDWEKKLDARIKQRDALKQAYQTALNDTEAATLPLLRDALIDAINLQGFLDLDLADWLTQRLSISFKYNGEQRLTRLEQGVETLQDILLSLRTGRLSNLATLPVGAALPAWEIKLVEGEPDDGEVDTSYSEEDFDTEWEWMGSYATWRGAMFAFAYPENYLLPTLRDKSQWTKAFTKLVKDVRQQFRLTFNKAEELAQEYLQTLNSSLKDDDKIEFELTSQLTKEELRTRRKDSDTDLKSHFDPEDGFKPNTPQHLLEVYFYVPMLLAQSLQKSGDFLAALDWYQTVYAYELPLEERKVYYGLEAEETLPTEFARNFSWLLDGLDVFQIASDRANAVTRFTILSIVRCYLAYAHAEFTRETNESIPLARRLYLTALELLELLQSPVPQAQAHWTFDEDEGTSAIDVTGNGHTAILQGSQLSDEGLQGGAVSCSGQADYVEVPHSPALALGEDGSDFSVAFAIYLREGATGQFRTLLRKGTATNSNHRTPGIWLRPNDDTIHFRISTTESLSEGTNSTSELELDVWTHIAYVKRGKSLKLYINGQLDKEETLDGDSISFEAPLFIGGDPVSQPDGSIGGTNASFDDIRVYDRALSADVVTALSGTDVFPTNPVVNALGLHAEVNLRKLRNGLNIAGIERIRTETTAVELIATDGVLAPPSNTNLKPSAYRYSALIERAKQLVTIAQQIEASFLSALEKRDAEAYNLLNAQQDVQLTKETVELQELRILEADSSITLMELQSDRAQTQFDTFNSLINAGANEYERAMLKNYQDLKDSRNYLAAADAIATVANATVTAASANFSMPAAMAAVGTLGIAAGARAKIISDINQLEAETQTNSFNANLERRKDEWRLQKALANHDINIAAQQIFQAGQHKQIIEQERDIASLQSENAQAVVEFLNNKFTNVELYEWMSDILGEVYSYFLQQATSMAQLAFNQLSFERQERPPAYIQSDYWQIPSDRTSSEEEVDRRGLTGSARLLQDIYQLDQYAFDSNQRKLQLTESFSLARLFPYEFQEFRETGVLPFATPMSMFDRSFPGHYLRLIKRVRVSVVGLIPPTEGIRASLSSAGVSRAVTGDTVFRTTEIRRPPEAIAFTSPNNATGLFELQPENELLLPFETMGVDTNWELQLPKAANRFNFDSIADVIFTVEYTALQSFDYRRQIIQELDRTFSAERAYSFRQDFPDLWYDLHQPEALIDEENGNIQVQFAIEQSHFPPNLDSLRIEHLVLYFVGADDSPLAIEVTNLLVSETSYGGAVSMDDGVISTRRSNAANWSLLLGESPIGDWTFNFPNTPEFISLFEDEKINDILFIVSYSGDTPAWTE